MSRYLLDALVRHVEPPLQRRQIRSPIHVLSNVLRQLRQMRALRCVSPGCDLRSFAMPSIWEVMPGARRPLDSRQPCAMPDGARPDPAGPWQPLEAAAESRTSPRALSFDTSSETPESAGEPIQANAIDRERRSHSRRFAGAYDWSLQNDIARHD
jgi:hypothetical protein